MNLSVLSQQDCDIYRLAENSPENNVWSCACYVINTENSAIVIDPGYTRFERARELLKEKGIDSGIILLTHGHWDHYYGAFDLLCNNGFSEMHVHEQDRRYIDDLVALIKTGESTPEKVRAVSENLSALHNNKLNLKLDFLPPNPDELNCFEDKVSYFDVDAFLFEHDGLRYSCQHDGSHTKGHVTYRIGRVLFAGDLVSMKKGKLQIEPRMDHEEPGVARGKREIKNRTITALRQIIKDRSLFDYVALGHGGIIRIGEFVEKTARYVA